MIQLFGLAFAAFCISAVIAVACRSLILHPLLAIGVAAFSTGAIGVVGDALVSGAPVERSQMATWLVPLFLPGTVIGLGGAVTATCAFEIARWLRQK